MPGFSIRPLHDDDRVWVARLLEERWGAARIVTRGRLHAADRLPGFIAEVEGQPTGLVTFRLAGGDCEVVSLDSLHERIGVGTALLEAVRKTAQAAECRRLWLITTNDNLAALRFYQKRGWRLVAIHRDALDESRRLKPEIPLVGTDGIPLCDEIELELPP
jgi:GNAT superfamily N-acetyltransferase